MIILIIKIEGFMFAIDGYYSSGSYSFDPGEMLLKELFECPQIRVLIKEAQKIIVEEGLDALKVCFEETKSGFDAEREDNVIRIKPDLSIAKQRSCLVFELTNVIQYKKFKKVHKSAFRGVIKTAEEFARAKELIEYEGLRRQNLICRSINQEKGYSYLESPWVDVNLETIDFDTFYNSYLSEEHKEYQRKQFESSRPSFIEAVFNQIFNPSSI